MHQQIKDKLHYYVPHGLMACSNINGECPFELTIRGYEMIIYGRETNIMFRPLSSLTKEIMVPGYNGDKPFVPLDILGINHGDDLWITLEVEPLSLPFWIIEELFKMHFWLWDQQLFASGDIIEIKD